MRFNGRIAKDLRWHLLSVTIVLYAPSILRAANRSSSRQQGARGCFLQWHGGRVSWASEK